MLEEPHHLPDPWQSQVETVEAEFAKFAAYHREPWLPNTNNDLENNHLAKIEQDSCPVR